MKPRTFFSAPRIRLGGGQNVGATGAASAPSPTTQVPRPTTSQLALLGINSTNVYQALSTAEKMASIDTRVPENNNYYYDRLQDSRSSLSYETVTTLYSFEKLLVLQEEYIRAPSSTPSFLTRLNYYIREMDNTNVLKMVYDLLNSLDVVQAQDTTVNSLTIFANRIVINSYFGQENPLEIRIATRRPIEGKIRYLIEIKNPIVNPANVAVLNTLTNENDTGIFGTFASIASDFARRDEQRLNMQNMTHLLFFILVLFKNTNIHFY